MQESKKTLQKRKLSKSLGIVFIVCAFIAIFILVELFSGGFLATRDRAINAGIPELYGGFLTFASKIVEVMFDTWFVAVMALIIAIFLWYKREKKEAFFLMVVIIIDAAIIFIIKEIVRRARPSDGLIAAKDFAFPSGHTTTAVVFFGLLTYLILRKTKSSVVSIVTIVVSLLFVCFIGFTRLYLGVHWFSDVLGGLAIGACILTGSILAREKIEEALS